MRTVAKAMLNNLMNSVNTVPAPVNIIKVTNKKTSQTIQYIMHQQE